MLQHPQSEQFDLFISYAHVDNQGEHEGKVSALVDAIKEEHARFTPDPLRLFFDLEDIRSMDDWEHRIYKGLRESKIMLAVLSPAYFKSPYCKKEWERYVDNELALALPGEGIAPIYIISHPDFDTYDKNSTLDRWLQNLKRRQYVEFRLWWPDGLKALQREDVRKRLAGLEQNMWDRISRLKTRIQAPRHLPARNERFVGREGELRTLREKLAFGKIGAVTAVQGIAGMGKSVLAFEYAYRYGDAYPGGQFVINAANVADLRLPIIELAPYKGLDISIEERKDTAAAFHRVKAAFESGPPALLILDNVQDAALLSPASRAQSLPSPEKVHVLVTTCLEPDRMPGLDCLALGALTAEEAMQLLARYRPFPESPQDDEWKAARALVRRLGGHALAMEVVAVFLWQHPEISYRAFLSGLERKGVMAKLEQAGQAAAGRVLHPQTLIGPLLEPTLAGLSPLERFIVEYASLLPPNAVPVPWLHQLAAAEFRELRGQRDPDDPDPWRQALRRLDGLRLLTAADDARLGRMHRLVQEMVAAAIPADRNAARKMAIQEYALSRAKFLLNGWVDQDARWEIEPLREYCLASMDAEEIVGAKIAPYMHSLMEVEPFAARTLLRRAIAIEKQIYGAMQPPLAVLYSNLAAVELRLGNLSKARKLLLRAIAIDKRFPQTNDNDPRLAVRYSNLAVVEEYLGNLSKARLLHLRAISLGRKFYQTADHPWMAIFYSNLAMTEHALNNFQKARKLLARAIAIDRRFYQRNHPTLALRYSQLAQVENELGNQLRAMKLLKRALTITKKVYGADHPRMAELFVKMAGVEIERGDLEGACSWTRGALEIYLARFGEDHPDTQSLRSFLAENDPGFHAAN